MSVEVIVLFVMFTGPTSSCKIDKLWIAIYWLMCDSHMFILSTFWAGSHTVKSSLYIPLAADFLYLTHGFCFKSSVINSCLYNQVCRKKSYTLQKTSSLKIMSLFHSITVTEEAIVAMKHFR